MMRQSNLVDLFREVYNHRRPHMSSGVNGENKTPAHAFIHKIPPREKAVIDKQAVDECRVK